MFSFIDRMCNTWLNWRADREAKKHPSMVQTKSLAFDAEAGGWWHSEGTFTGEGVALLARECAKMLELNNSENYVEFDMIAPESQKLVRVLVKWAHGESPAQQNVRLRKEIAELKEENAAHTD